MTRPRLTIRRVMLGIVAIAALLRLILVAVQVFGQPNANILSHLRRRLDDDSPFVFNHGTTPSQYWSEYWRRVLGLPWPGGFVCSCKAEDDRENGRPSVDIATSHDMDALQDRLNTIPWVPPRRR